MSEGDSILAFRQRSESESSGFSDMMMIHNGPCPNPGYAICGKVKSRYGMSGSASKITSRVGHGKVGSDATRAGGLYCGLKIL